MAHLALVWPAPRPISRCDLLFHPEGRIYPRKTMAQHDLLLILEGSVVIREGAETHELKPGDALVLFAGRDHGGVGRSTAPLRFFYAHFAADDRDRLGDRPWPASDRDRLVLPSVTPAKSFLASATRLCEEILYLKQSRKPIDGLRASNLLERLLLDLASVHEANPEPEDPMVAQILRGLAREDGQGDSVAEMAARFQRTPRTLLSHFRKVTGKSIREARMELRLRRAAAMLESHSPVKLREVARDTGFYDEYHLGHAFKAHFGVSPSLYRSRFREESRSQGRA